MSGMAALTGDRDLPVAVTGRVNMTNFSTLPAVKLENRHVCLEPLSEEHVDDLDSAYAAMLRWLSPNGFISHQVDFKSHGTAREWNGHWTISKLQWRLMRGRRPSLINRQPCSAHLRLLQKHAFRTLVEKRVPMESALNRHRLAAPFKSLSDEDLTTSGVFLLAVPQAAGT